MLLSWQAKHDVAIGEITRLVAAAWAPVALLKRAPKSCGPEIQGEIAKLAATLPVAAYVNFVGDEGEDRVLDAYPPATLERLRRVKATYDPTNLFHRNQNIRPTEEAAR